MFRLCCLLFVNCEPIHPVVVVFGAIAVPKPIVREQKDATTSSGRVQVLFELHDAYLGNNSLTFAK
jgi:hypothetical protein